jgi:hypothetical protein
MKCRHFDTIELIEAETQAVLNTLTEHGFQDAFKNGRSAWNCAYERKWNTLTVTVASRTKIIFLPDGSTDPGN